MSQSSEGALPAARDEATAHPLWPVVLVLGEIAQRVARRQGEERTAMSRSRPIVHRGLR